MWATVNLARRHWMFWLLLAGGLVLRGIAQVAYEPALLFIDSKKYIFGTDFTNTIWGSFDPLGYSLLILRPILACLAGAWPTPRWSSTSWGWPWRARCTR